MSWPLVVFGLLVGLVVKLVAFGVGVGTKSGLGLLKKKDIKAPLLFLPLV